MKGRLIPVNLVTGFLGVGKTTLIRHLLQNHPQGENWAVLVNEFGEIGVDGALLDREGVTIQEVAGGCLCCVAAPAFSVGLNRLIREQRPDRILVEPSGLGHPAQVLDTLRKPPYDQVLDVRATFCVMDARHLSSTRHLEHPNFQDQIHVADVLLANKMDRYTPEDESAFRGFVRSLQPPKQKLGMVEQGRVPLAWLDLNADPGHKPAFPEAHAFLVDRHHDDTHEHGHDIGVAPAGDWLLIEGAGDGYHRAGWEIGPAHRFAADALFELLDRLPYDRVKGVFVTSDSSAVSYNRADADRQVQTVQHSAASQLQIIHHQPLDAAAVDLQLRAVVGEAGAGGTERLQREPR